jgi:phospholipase C
VDDGHGHAREEEGGYLAGTYPDALNPCGEPAFHARQDTPTINGLKGALLTHNPNLDAANGAGGTNPFRLSRSQAWTASQNHDYTPEQVAYDKSLMDLFPLKVGTPDKAAMKPAGLTAPPAS